MNAELVMKIFPQMVASLNKMKNLSAEIQIIVCDKGYLK